MRKRVKQVDGTGTLRLTAANLIPRHWAVVVAVPIRHLCSPCDSTLPDMGECPYYVDYSNCGTSPILIDVNGNGFSLTDQADGVAFDIDGNPGNVKEWLS